MKIGIFDSGLGGLFVTESIIKRLPQYQYIYLGDTKRAPYGDRSEQTIYRFTKEAVNYLFDRDCQLIVIACNTVSAKALRRIQQQYLTENFGDERRVLGIIIPTVETITNSKRVGVLATAATVKFNSYKIEFKKHWPKVKVFQRAAPLLVPLIEQGNLTEAKRILPKYVKPLLKARVDTIVLGCTHYAILKAEVQKLAPEVKIIAQNDIVAKSLKDYLQRHPEIEKKIDRTPSIEFLATKITPEFRKLVNVKFGKAKVKAANL